MIFYILFLKHTMMSICYLEYKMIYFISSQNRSAVSGRFLIENLLKTIDFLWFFFAFPCSGNTPAPGASGGSFWGPGAHFSCMAAPQSGRYLRSKRGIRFQAQLRLAHVPTRSLAFLARFAPVPTRTFLGVNSRITGPILEGSRRQIPYFV